MNEDLLKSTYRRFMGKMILNNLMVFLGSLVNGIVISRYLGIEAMAAFQLTFPLVFTVMMFSQIINIGVQNNCAKSLGAGRAQDASAYYSVALVAILPLSIAVAAGLFGYAESIVVLLGGSGEIADLAAAYLRGISLGLPLLLFLPMQSAVFFLTGQAKCVIRSVAVQSVVNVVGALVNVFYLRGGMLGMGIVMSCCYVAALLVMLREIRQGSNCIRFLWRGWQWRQLWPILRIGFPSATDRFFKTIQMFVINHVLLITAPLTAMASFAVLNSLNYIFLPIAGGLSATTLTMSGVFFGEKDKDSLRGLLKISLAESLPITLLTATITFLAAPILVRLFMNGEGEALETTIAALRIYIWYLPLFAINNIFQKYYLGVNALSLTYLSSAMENLLFVCLLGTFFGLIYGETGVWAAFVFAEILAIFGLVLIIALRKKAIPRTPDDFLQLPTNFQRGKIFTGSATNMNEVINLSEATRLFLLNNGVSKREAMLVALSIEEMGKNIIRWGFGDGRKHSIDILVRKDESLTLRIRDDCAPFDPVEWLKIHQDNDKLKNIGIRMICKLATEARYSRTLGLNYLFLRW
ncbi:MAG: ATP-binding protein [Prevotella sp.]|nr:ATP-binding protein [Prevotella sp.]MBR6125383.1 ATP-binding protein [Candidatus Saccharibacteria bacterium]MBR6125966.1 ATP-binding protein [Candidatus Saccharibacteria bacterium]